MKKKIFALFLLLSQSAISIAQDTTANATTAPWKKIYRSAPERINNLVHTKLEARFDYDKSQLNGKAWITLKPHFYPVDSLLLDAKGMTIHKVQLAGNEKYTALPYRYDSLVLHIKLDKRYTQKEHYKVYIEYTARPDEYKGQGSDAIKEAKGLYFINPRGEDKEKPTQIWTQGETEGTSVWIPTIDRPNQKTTQEMYLTVPDQYVSLSNGKLMSQKKNKDGTRTDYWKMDLPHAPYLFFIGIGDYAIIKDSYKGKEVSYYVEKEYKDVARKIFGHTPEMMKFFSDKLGIDYPWIKYAQITGRDYVSGAMENTTSTLHSDVAQQNARELVDENRWESVIAHELFHHWFGDLVTAESWSNLTVNESFADYSELLWDEYKYGKDAADYANLSAMLNYFNSRSQDKDLVRYFYKTREDMFDAVSYQKGGRVLHMLRDFVGDDAFFKSLNVYLERNRFGTGNARELQQALEDVTGKDLNWFFDQWYFGNGHPILDISYTYDESKKATTVRVKQLQEGDKVFRLPFAIDVYHGKDRKRHNVWMESRADSFLLPSPSRPDLVNVDGKKVLLAIKRENRTPAEYLHLLQYAGTLVDRWEAVEYAGMNPGTAESKTILTQGLNDPFYLLRGKTIRSLDTENIDPALVKKIETMASGDARKVVKALAIDFLGKLKDKKYEPLFLAGTKDSSYTVAALSLTALAGIDENKAISLLPELKKDVRGELRWAIQEVEIYTKTDDDFDEIYTPLQDGTIEERYNGLPNFATYLTRIRNTDNFKKGVDLIMKIRDQIVAVIPSYKEEIAEELYKIKLAKESSKGHETDAGVKQQIEYLEQALGK